MRVYVPAIAAVALADTIGLWDVELKLSGPDQEYEVIPPGPPVRVNKVPTQTGPLLDAVAKGRGFTTTVVVVALLHPPALITVRVYIPAIAAVALVETVGLWREEAKLFGPVHE